MQLSQCLFDTTHGFDDILVRSSIAHTNALRSTESGTTYAGYVAHFKQIHGQISCTSNHPLAIRFSKIGAAFREKIESAFGHVHFESRNLLCQLHNQITTTLESLAHLFYRRLRASISCLGRLLRYRAWTGRILSLQLTYIVPAICSPPLRSIPAPQ